MNFVVCRGYAARVTRYALAVAAAISVAATGIASAQNTAVRFSLDSKLEGPMAPFAVAIDRGYYRAEGLEVTIDAGVGPIEPINRVASGNYDLAFTDINTLIKFRDANPQTPIKAVFMVYNKPPYAVVGRKSRGVAAPKDLEGKKLGAPAADGERVVAHGIGLRLRADGFHRALPTHARPSRLLSDGLGRQRTADGATRPELLRRAL